MVPTKPVEEPDFWARDEVQPRTAGPTTWIPGETSWAMCSEAVSVESLNGRPPTACTTRWSKMRGVKTYPADKVVEVNGPFGIAQPVFCDDKTWSDGLAAMKAHGVAAEEAE